jgi:propanol-preferring alcohol dehydrogenase
VSGVREGDRVAVPRLGWACGTCEWCASGWETLCPNQRNTGYSIDGVFAEYVLADARFVGRVPDGLDPFDAAPLTCAGLTTYKAVKVSRTRPSELVAIFGGGLGHLALQYAQIAGGTVVAVDLVDHKLDVAEGLGAAYTVNATRDDAAAIQELGGADAAIVLAASPLACDEAFRSLRRNGRLVLVGLPAHNEMRLPTRSLVVAWRRSRCTTARARRCTRRQGLCHPTNHGAEAWRFLLVDVQLDDLEKTDGEEVRRGARLLGAAGRMVLRGRAVATSRP